jgi:long-chain acyl-CoA synthetase
MNNWFDHILFYTRAHPAQPAMIMEDRVVTYGMLRIALESIARRIAALNIDQDSGPVAVLVQNPIRHLTLCLALFRTGFRSISLEHAQPGIGEQRFAAVFADGEAKGLIGPANRIIDVTDAWFANEPPGSDILPDAHWDDQQDCRLALTSGTTGAPKLFGYSVEFIGRHIPTVIVYNCRRVLGMLGLSLSYGFVVACATLATGKTLCFAASPFQAIRMVELFSIDFILGGPDQLAALVRAGRKSGAHLPSLRTIVTGGGVATRALLEAAMIHLCKNILCRYGTSELGLVAEATASEVLSKPALVGHIVPDVKIAVFDQNGERCPPGEVGIVRGRHTARADASSWMDLDDIGWVTSERQLYVTARTVDVSEGPQSPSPRDISPVHEVEHLVRLEWDAADAAAVMVEKTAQRAAPEIWIGIVDGKDVSSEKVAALLRSRGMQHPVRLFDLHAIPRSSNGKVNRQQLKALMSGMA